MTGAEIAALQRRASSIEAVAADLGVRARLPGAEAAPRRGAAAAAASRRDDRRRGQRRTRAQAGRHRRGHGRGAAPRWRRRRPTSCSPTTTSPRSRRPSRRGGGVFDNLTKFIVWTLPTNMGEGLLILVAIVAGVDAADPPGADPLDQHDHGGCARPDARLRAQGAGHHGPAAAGPGRPLLTGGLIGRILLVSALLLGGLLRCCSSGRRRTGCRWPEARTVAVNVFVVGELFYLLNCRSLERSMFRVGVFSNPWVTGGVATMVGLQILHLRAACTRCSTAPLDPQPGSESSASGSASGRSSVPRSGCAERVRATRSG